MKAIARPDQVIVYCNSCSSKLCVHDAHGDQTSSMESSPNGKHTETSCRGINASAAVSVMILSRG